MLYDLIIDLSGITPDKAAINLFNKLHDVGSTRAIQALHR
jgi:hypothetical protein